VVEEEGKTAQKCEFPDEQDLWVARGLGGEETVFQLFQNPLSTIDRFIFKIFLDITSDINPRDPYISIIRIQKNK
jgi:hypothetical protein